MMSMCRVFSCVVGRGCLLWPVRSLGKILLAFVLLHSVLQGQIFLLLQVSLDFLLLHSSPLWWKDWKDWCWSWNSNTWVTGCKELTRWKKPWCWERAKAGGEGDDRGWDGWMASPTQRTWVWVNPRSWWRTGRPGVLQSMGSQSRTWLSGWTELNLIPQSHLMSKQMCSASPCFPVFIVFTFNYIYSEISFW